MKPERVIKSADVKVNAEVLQKLLEFSEAILEGDFTKRVITDFSDHIVTRIANNLNRFADQRQSDTSSRQELEEERQMLKMAKEQAEAANNAKSLFLANMSHEIRTPLNGILGLTQIMQMEDVSAEFRSYLDMIHTSGKSLTKLINDILDFSKIESGKMELENIRFNFHKTINSNLEQHKILAEQKGLSLTCHINDSVPVDVLGDPVRIIQVVSNILNNAIKFTERGSIKATFSAIEIGQDCVVIQSSIRDTGIGIRPEARSKIFQSFTQADNSVSRKFGGTGLGLSIAKRLVEMMDGSISVHNYGDQINQTGTDFTFTIRLKVPMKKLVKGTSETGRERLSFSKAWRVLIVDDNQINLLVAQKMVERFGGVVTSATNGWKAINKVKQNEFDFILMDIQMPVMDGHEATRQLRDSGFTKPIIALSANAFKKDVEKSLHSGMDAHLQKPFSEGQLFRVINESLGIPELDAVYT